MMKRRFLSLWIACLLCDTSLVFSQDISAELRRAIRDPSGATIPNASIRVKNAATGITRTTASNTAGIFNIPDLQPADYEMTVSAGGFADQLLTNIQLSVGTHRVL